MELGCEFDDLALGREPSIRRTGDTPVFVAVIAAAGFLLLGAATKTRTTSECAHVLGQHAPTTVRTECVGSKDAHLCQEAAIVQTQHLYL